MTEPTSNDPFAEAPGLHRPVVAHAIAARVWEATEAAFDHIWFETRPSETSRTRPASALERAAYGLPDHTTVVVSLAPDGAEWVFATAPSPPDPAG